MSLNERRDPKESIRMAFWWKENGWQTSGGDGEQGYKESIG